jgi:tetratricopeptide (TPR) repeat protein
LGNYPQALHFLEQALTLRKMIDDRAGIGQSLVNLAAVYQSQGNYPQALDFYQQALIILKEQNEQYGQAVVFNNMGELHRS